MHTSPACCIFVVRPKEHSKNSGFCLWEKLGLTAQKPQAHLCSGQNAAQQCETGHNSQGLNGVLMDLRKKDKYVSLEREVLKKKTCCFDLHGHGFALILSVMLWHCSKHSSDTEICFHLLFIKINTALQFGS